METLGDHNKAGQCRPATRVVWTCRSGTEGICHPHCTCVQDGKIGLIFICIMSAASCVEGGRGEHFFHLIHHRVRFVCSGHLDNLVMGTQNNVKSSS